MRLYGLPIAATASPAAIFDIAELIPATNIPIAIVGIDLGQGTDLGDANEEELALTVIHGHATSGSGGSAGAPAPLDPRDAAASFTAELMNTTIASTGTPITVRNKPWFIRGPFLWVPAPEERPRCDAGQTRLVVRCSAPADAITVHGELVIAEL